MRSWCGTNVRCADSYGIILQRSLLSYGVSATSECGAQPSLDGSSLTLLSRPVTGSTTNRQGTPVAHGSAAVSILKASRCFGTRGPVQNKSAPAPPLMGPLGVAVDRNGKTPRYDCPRLALMQCSGYRDWHMAIVGCALQRFIQVLAVKVSSVSLTCLSKYTANRSSPWKSTLTA